MAGLTLSASRGKTGAAARLKKLPAQLGKAQAVAMERAVKHVERDLKTNSFSGKTGKDAFWGTTGASGDMLGVRTGHTRRSIVSRTFAGALGTIAVGTIGSPLKHVSVHEHGGTIRGNPWLRIPTAVMQTGAGVDRLTGTSARSLPNTTTIKSKKGNVWIAEVGTPRARLAQEYNGVPLLLYLLKTQVTLRPRRMFKRSLARTRSTIRALFRGRFSAVVRSN